jgi:hypothetical protein
MADIAYIAQTTVNDFAQVQSKLKYSARLAATTNTQTTVPSSSPRYKAVITVESGGDVWFSVNNTAAAPAGASFAATNSELITGSKEFCREVKAGDVLNFFSLTADVDTSIVYYALGNNSGY